MSEPQRIPAINTSGDLVTIDAADAEKAFANGYKPASADTLQTANDQLAEAGPVGALKAGTAGAASMLTLGGSDYAIPKLAGAFGGDEALTRRRLAAAYEMHPVAKGVGEAASLLVPVGEIAALGRAGKVASAIPRGISALGEGAAKLGAEGLAGLTGRAAAEAVPTLLGRAVQAAIPMAARGVAEGAAYGVQHEISESALTDDFDHLGEKLWGVAGSALAGGALGGVLGGAIGLGEGAAAKWLKPGTVGDVDAILGADGAGSTLAKDAAHNATLGRMTDAATTTPAEVGSVVGTARTHAGLTGITDAATEKFIAAKFADDPELADVYRAAYGQRAGVLSKQEGILDEQTRALTEAGSDALKAERTLSEVAHAQKAEQIAKLVEPANAKAATQTTLQAWQDVRDTLATIAEDPTKGGIPMAVNKAGRYLEKFEQEFTTINKGPKDQRAARMFIALDDLKRAVGKGAQFGQGPFGLPEGAKAMDELYHRIRPLLEDEAVWGKAGAAQREINDATTTKLATRDMFAKTFTTNYDSAAGRPLERFDPADVKSFLSNVNGAQSDLKKEALRKWLADERAHAAVIEKHYSMTPAERASVESGKQALTRLENTLNASEKQASTVAKIRAIQAQEQASHLGGALGLAADFTMSPMKTIGRLASLRHAAEKFDEKLGAGVDRLLSGKANEVPISEVGSKRDALFRKRMSDVASDAANPKVQQTRVAEVMGDLADAAPKTAAALAATATRATNYLASRIPQPALRTSALMRNQKTEYSDADKEAYLRQYDYVHDPVKVVSHITPEAVAVAKAVYPKIYADMQKRVMDQLADSSKFIPVQKRMELSILLGIPGDPLLEPGVGAAIAKARESAPPKAPPHKAIPEKNELMSGIQTIAMGGTRQ